MLGKWIEESVMFQTGDVLQLYGVIFGALLVIVVLNYMKATRKK